MRGMARSPGNGPGRPYGQFLRTRRAFPPLHSRSLCYREEEWRNTGSPSLVLPNGRASGPNSDGRTSVGMITPFYFGSADRTLFGAYHPAATGGRRGAVLCYPWGQEYLRSHKAMCFLASLLSDRGFHVLRFDWYGSGDSAGECFEGGEPGSLDVDLQDAVTEAEGHGRYQNPRHRGPADGSGRRRAQLALRGSEVHRLVLWDPVVDGAERIHALLGERGTNLSRAPSGRSRGRRGRDPRSLGIPAGTPRCERASLRFTSPFWGQASRNPSALLRPGIGIGIPPSGVRSELGRRGMERAPVSSMNPSRG